jgi:hypothetical protein
MILLPLLKLDLFGNKLQFAFIFHGLTETSADVLPLNRIICYLVLLNFVLGGSKKLIFQTARYIYPYSITH